MAGANPRLQWLPTEAARCILVAVLAMALAGCVQPDQQAPTSSDGAPTAGTSHPASSGAHAAPSPRVGPAMTYDAGRGVIVLFGGQGDGKFLQDTWERRGATWTKSTPSTAPPGRTGASMVYDSARGVSVLFGGQDAGGGSGEASFLADTWEWNGQTWTDRTPPVSPGARYYAAAAFDRARNVTVLYGGSDRGHSVFDETWEWDGHEWTSYAAAPPSPSARADAAMVCDPHRRACTLFGGDDGTQPTDTWEREGTAWSQKSPPTAPPDRRGTTMVYDEARSVTVLFGGHHGPRPPDGSLLADTWEWNGTTWTERATAASPPSRSAHGMAYDSSRAVSVVFGGNGGGAPLGDTWEWDGSTWTIA